MNTISRRSSLSSKTGARAFGWCLLSLVILCGMEGDLRAVMLINTGGTE